MSSTQSSSFEARVDERRVGPCRLLVLPAPVDQVVSWRASFDTLPDFAEDEELVQELAVTLLDKGTRTRDRFELARVLEDRGAQLNLSNDGLQVSVSGRALADDVPAVMEILAEMLFEPVFPLEEFQKAKAQVAASLQRDMEDTGSQASGELTRHLYAPSHPNYSPPPRELLAKLQSLSREDIERYHAAHFGANRFIMAVAGDVDPDVIADVVGEHFEEWSAHDAPSRHTTEALPAEAGESTLPMPDKMNVDVRMGHALDVRRQDDDYIPLHLANYVLGGNFSARLMTAVRDEMGLTYGIGSNLSGVSTEHAGHWTINVTLSQDKLEEGLTATQAVVERFVEDGVTEEELQEKKTTVTGSFKVGLATTGRQARLLLVNARRDFDIGYLDRFPEEVEAVTLEEVNRAIEEHFHPDKFFVAQAGTLPEPAPTSSS